MTVELTAPVVAQVLASVQTAEREQQQSHRCRQAGAGAGDHQRGSLGPSGSLTVFFCGDPRNCAMESSPPCSAMHAHASAYAVVVAPHKQPAPQSLHAE